MSLQSRVLDLANRIANEFKLVKARLDVSIIKNPTETQTITQNHHLATPLEINILPTTAVDILKIREDTNVIFKVKNSGSAYFAKDLEIDDGAWIKKDFKNQTAGNGFAIGTENQGVNTADFMIYHVGTSGDSLINCFSGGTSTSATSGGTSKFKVDVLGNMTVAKSITCHGSGLISTNSTYGLLALNSNTTGAYNTASGYQSLESNTTGDNNTASGYHSLRLNTTGNNNTASGSRSLRSNTTGTNNTASGYHSLESNTAGSINTSYGSFSLTSNTLGNNNIAIGYASLYQNTEGNQNVAVGNDTLRSNMAGSDNVAVGHAALKSNTSSKNVAIGGNAAFSNISANTIVAIGFNSLQAATNTSGTAVGYYSFKATTGNNNTGLGAFTGNDTTTGYENTFLGSQAGLVNTTGFRNTAVGSTALSNGTNYSNVTCLGYNSQATASNQVQLGDTNTTVLYSALAARSDERDKAEIRDTVLGLNFINALRPVDFKWDYRSDYVERTIVEEETENGKTIKQETIEHTRDGSKKRTRYHHGLIAQEVKNVIDATGVDFGGYQDHKINGGNDVLSLSYEELIAPLIKAIQELSDKNEELTNRLENLENVNR